MIYVFDTDILTVAELPSSREYQNLHRRVLDLTPDDAIATKIVTYEEQTRGWLAYASKSRQTAHQIKSYARLHQHLQTYLKIEILDFNERAGQEFDRLRDLKVAVGTADLKIAAIVIAHNGVLLSRNLKDFKKIPNLRIEDWTGR